MNIVAVVIFGLTYVLISARRTGWLGLDRPAGALVGAVACVVLEVLTPAQALTAVDGATLLLLFGVMGMGAFLAVDGFFEQLEQWLLARARTPQRLLGFVVWGAGLSAALITNDAVCVLAAPLVVRLIKSQHLPALPFLLALATGANTGSVATLVGNPQNMLCGLLGGLTYRDHLLLMAPVALFGLAVNHALLGWMFRRALARASLTRPRAAAGLGPALSGRAWLTVLVIAASAVVYTAGGDLAWTSVSALVVLMLVHRRDTRQLWPRIDWALLLFFGGLFVVVAGLQASGAPAALFERFSLADTGSGLSGGLYQSAIFLVGSNIVSNVPFILVVQEQMTMVPEPRLSWELLAMASTFAGNLTLLGSVANIIVAEAAHEVGGIGFWEYLRLGLPLALLTTLGGALWVIGIGPMM